jgi:hypothetical protein
MWIAAPLPELQHQFAAPHLTVYLDTVREFVGVMDATGNVRAVTHKITRNGRAL